MLICFLGIYPGKSVYELPDNDFEQFKSILGIEDSLNGKSWGQLPVEGVFKALQSGNAGITSNEGKKAELGEYGDNELEIRKRGLNWGRSAVHITILQIV